MNAVRSGIDLHDTGTGDPMHGITTDSHRLTASQVGEREPAPKGARAAPKNLLNFCQSLRMKEPLK